MNHNFYVGGFTPINEKGNKTFSVESLKGFLTQTLSINLLNVHANSPINIILYTSIQNNIVGSTNTSATITDDIIKEQKLERTEQGGYIVSLNPSITLANLPTFNSFIEFEALIQHNNDSQKIKTVLYLIKNNICLCVGLQVILKY